MRQGHAKQSQVLLTLSLSQLFSAVGNGVSLAVGSIMAVELSGSEAWGGATTTAISVAGAISALPLARLALIRGRRTALSCAYGIAGLGAAGMMLAPVLQSFGLLLFASLLIGLGQAGNLQARFAATDLSVDHHRGRDLSLVVWAITVGAVAGPNLIGPGAVLAGTLGLPDTSGPFLFSVVGMVIAVVVLQVGLRPDPLAHRVPLPSKDTSVHADRGVSGAAVADSATAKRPGLIEGLRAAFAHRQTALGIATVVSAHAVMVSVMAMTPVHLARAAQRRSAEDSGAPSSEAGDGQEVAHHHEADLGALTDFGADTSESGVDALTHHTDTDTLVLIGLVISLHIAGMFAFSPLMGWLADTWGKLPTMLAAQAVLASSMILGALGAGSDVLVTVALALLGLGWSMATVAGSAHVTATVSDAHRVLVQGVCDTLMGAAGACGAALSGVLLALVGFAGLNLTALGVVFVMALWIAAMLRLSGHSTSS